MSPRFWCVPRRRAGRFAGNDGAVLPVVDCASEHGVLLNMRRCGQCRLQQRQHSAVDQRLHLPGHRDGRAVHNGEALDLVPLHALRLVHSVHAGACDAQPNLCVFGVHPHRLLSVVVCRGTLRRVGANFCVRTASCGLVRGLLTQNRQRWSRSRALARSFAERLERPERVRQLGPTLPGVHQRLRHGVGTDR